MKHFWCLFLGDLFTCAVFFFLFLPSRLQQMTSKKRVLKFWVSPWNPKGWNFISWVWNSPRLLALLVQQSLFYFYFEASGLVQSYMSPLLPRNSDHGTWRVQICFLPGKIGEKWLFTCFEVQRCFRIHLFNDEKNHPEVSIANLLWVSPNLGMYSNSCQL